MAVEPGDAKFVSKLNEASKKKAKDELNEINDKDRELAVQAFRQWVLEQSWIKSPTDFEFLLRFLRARKFSQLRTRQIFENYWKARAEASVWFTNIDPHDEKIVEIIRSGIYLVPRKRDKHGRRVVFERLGELDMTKLKERWGQDLLYKAVTMVCDWTNTDENVQVNGMVYVSDCTGITMSMMSAIFDRKREKVMMDYFQDALPARMKGIHIYNEPSFFDALFAVFSVFMKQKTKDRMKLHGRSLTSLYEDIGMECMPDEYLPDDYTGPSAGSVDQIADEMVSDMQSPEFTKYIRELSSDKYGGDLSQRKKEEIPASSFRKLNLD